MNKPLTPGDVIGILGGGQLGRMLAVAAAQLGFRVHIYAPDKEPPAADVAAFFTHAEYDDDEALSAFFKSVDIVTYEFENIPASAIDAIDVDFAIYPPLSVLSVTQDRFEEKSFLESIGIPVAPYASVDTFNDFRGAVDVIGLPAMLKTRRFGYDGKGQAKVNASGKLEDIYTTFSGVPCILEAFIPFKCELSIVMARSSRGDIHAYDISRNIHENQILTRSVVPADVPKAIEERAYQIAETFARRTEYVGVFAIEFFYCGEDTQVPLIVNEIAPRVHNTGHWTIDACLISQFENHIRAIAGWPPGSTQRHSDAEMVNLIGEDALKWRTYAENPGASIHLYGKKEVRPGRKMGHVTILKSLLS